MRLPLLHRRRRAGFTLVELLAVILILSILVWALTKGLFDAMGATKVQTTRQLLAKLGAAAEHYQREAAGKYPPSSFEPGQEVGNDGRNVGIEAFVVALFSQKFEAGGLLEDVRDTLVNTDADTSPRQLTDFATRELLEVPDAWGNPVAYIERTDYTATNRRYLSYDGKTGEQLESAPVPFKNARTGQFYAAQTFQFISAGEDGQFGTDDDVTAFERED
jgi:prepilin-type N-terminal cleavage/methylation domain-containing protein